MAEIVYPRGLLLALYHITSRDVSSVIGGYTGQAAEAVVEAVAF